MWVILTVKEIGGIAVAISTLASAEICVIMWNFVMGFLPYFDADPLFSGVQRVVC